MMAKKANGEGSIYRRKVDGMYVGCITLNDGKRKYFYSKKRQEVYDKMQTALREKKQGTLIIEPQQTLERYLQSWLEDSVKGTLRSRTYERYEGIVRLHLVPVLGKVKLQSLAPQHVQSLKSMKLKEGLSANTVVLIHVVLHKALDDAVRLGLVARNVCDAVPPPHEEEKEIHPLTLEQIHRLLNAAKGHPLEALLILALATGMRRGELLALKWQDIDFRRGILHVRRILSRVPTLVRTDSDETYVEAEPKTKRSRRSIALASFAIDALKNHHSRQKEVQCIASNLWEDHDYVFCTPVGRHLSPGSSVLDPFKTLLKRAGLPDVRFHDLRHSAATLLLGEGVNPKVVQEILGHNKISTTMDIYSHVMPIMQDDAMDRLHRAFTDLTEEGDDDGEESGGVLARK